MQLRFAFTLAVLTLSAGSVHSQDLLISVRSAATGPGLNADPIEVFRGVPAAPQLHMGLETWHAWFGDRDSDGLLNDAPGNLDALHDAGTGLAGLWFSLDTNTSFPGQATIEDGDVFGLDGFGQPIVHHAEADFEGWTATSSIDVDAFAKAVDGTLYFSFAEDETTADPTLIARNGGNARIDEQAVFRLDPGATTATLHFDKDEVVAIFRQALTVNSSSVVDVIGIAIDPQGTPGDLLLTSASTSSTLRGRIVSSRAGGSLWLTGGNPTDPGALGFDASTSFDALSFARSPMGPTLVTDVSAGSGSAGGSGLLTVMGLAPGAPVQLIMTTAPASPQAWPVSGASNLLPTWNDPSDPMFWSSWRATPWQLTAAPDGIATYQFDFAGLPGPATAIVTAVDLSQGSLSLPLAISVLP